MKRRVLKKEIALPNLGDILLDGEFVKPEQYASGGKGVVVHINPSNRIVTVVGKTVGTAAWGTNIRVNGILMTTDQDQALNSFTGFEDTQVLKAYYGATGSYAFQKCLAVPNAPGFSQSGWYLPSVGEISYIASAFRIITNSMNKIGGLPSTNNWGNHCLLTTQYDSSMYWCWSISYMVNGIPNGLAGNPKSSNYNAPVYPYNRLQL